MTLLSEFKIVGLVCLLAFVLLPERTTWATVLSDAANGLQPGQWARIETGQDVGEVMQLLGAMGGGTNSNIIEYAGKGCYSTVHKKLMFAGGPHTGKSGFVVYDEMSNTWQVGPDPLFGSGQGTGHTYFNETCDRKTGLFYLRPGYTTKNYRLHKRYDPGSNSWSDIATQTVSPYVDTDAELEWFPHYGDQGIVLHLETLGGKTNVSYYDIDDDDWTRLSSVRTKSGEGGRDMVGAYSSLCQCVVWGGGKSTVGSKTSAVRDWFRVRVDDGDLINEELNPAPIAMRPRFTILAEDPITGHIVVFHDRWESPPIERKAFDYDPLKDIWTEMPLPGAGTIFEPPDPVNGKANEVFMAPIYPYGVLALVEYTPKGSTPWGSFWIYKHSVAAADSTPPAVVLAPAAQATSESASAQKASSSQSQTSGSTASQTAAVPPRPSKRSIGTEQPKVLSAADQDFANRCASQGVILCVGFDHQADIDPYILDPYHKSSTALCASQSLRHPCAVVDTAIHASGLGSLRFEIPSHSPSDSSGSFAINFSEDLKTQFGSGDEFFVQWRQRFSSDFLNTGFQGGGGWKQIIIGQGDRPGFTAGSCTQLEIVVQNLWQKGYPQMYHSCGQKDKTYDPIPGSRMSYEPDQWMTFQIRIKIGQWYKNDRHYRRDSAVQLWVAYEGEEPSLIVNRDPSPSSLLGIQMPGTGNGYDLANNNEAVARYGKVWLLPYHTHKSPKQSHPPGFVWYDELIVSTSKIPDPGEPSSDASTQAPKTPVAKPVPPSSPTNLILK